VANTGIKFVISNLAFYWVYCRISCWSFSSGKRFYVLKIPRNYAIVVHQN